MATYTQHYNLDKYEGTDRPNLRDQYNAAMDKIDAELYSQGQAVESHSTSITALQAAQIAASARMDTQDLAIDRAENASSQAVTIAQDAATDARRVFSIVDSDFDTWFAFPSGTIVDATKPHSVTGFGYTFEDGDVMLAFHLQVITRAITTSDYNSFKPLLKFRSFKNATSMFYQAPSEIQGTHPVTVEIPAIESTGAETPDGMYVAIYTGAGSAEAYTNGIRIGINMVCHLTTTMSV